VEDLLPFSDEGLIRAVHAARTPVVSAIGHEPDTPLLDLVADARASTPTDAAKMVVPDVAEEIDRITRLRDRGRQVMTAWLAQQQHQLDAVRARPSLATPGAASTTVPGRSPSCARAAAVLSSTSYGTRTATSSTSSPGCAACRRSPPWSAGTPWCRTPTVT
jgi:exodeoxyribonuclease VII large subunit